ncbi:MAG: DUF882 domain-containing protein [Rhizobiaceae bacterium]|nr:DUF882 domain-containing protein [Rhizobiaceae bacterium]
MLAVSFLLFAAPLASAETRTLKLYFVHTREKAEITFKKNGRYDQAGLQKINRFLRDWRRNEPTKMDPRLLDIVWEAYRQSGSRDYIHVISAYRSPATNSMLRSRSKGVAQKSQHMLGKAMDFYLPDVSLKKLRDIGLKMQAGGVGYYPRSGSPFVHLDVGNVRHWPKMSRQELVAVFPSGKTLHVPSDGKPLPGYELALASYESRKKNGGLAIASSRGGSGGGETTASSSSGGRKGLLAAFFGGGADEEEDNGDAEAVVAAAAPKASDSKIRVVAPDQAERVDVAPEPEAVVASLPEANIPLPGVAPRPLIDIGAPTPKEDIPFAVVPVSEGAAETQDRLLVGESEVAANVPLPTRRPSYEPEITVAMAIASDESTVPLPAGRPSADTAKEALLRAFAAAQTEADEVVVASLPRQQEGDAFAVGAEEIIAGEAGSVMAYAATPRGTLAARKDGTDPVAALRSGVKTTNKAGRASARDTRPEPRAIVVAAAPDEARWALTPDPVVTTSRAARAPSFASTTLNAAPDQVLTAGFERGTPVADVSRFHGKAVTFMSVARFQTN